MAHIVLPVPYKPRTSDDPIKNILMDLDLINVVANL